MVWELPDRRPTVTEAELRTAGPRHPWAAGGVSLRRQVRASVTERVFTSVVHVGLRPLNTEGGVWQVGGLTQPTGVFCSVQEVL